MIRNPIFTAECNPSAHLNQPLDGAARDFDYATRALKNDKKSSMYLERLDVPHDRAQDILIVKGLDSKFITGPLL